MNAQCLNIYIYIYKGDDKDEKVLLILYIMTIPVLATITCTIEFSISAGTEQQGFRSSWFIPMEG